MITICVPPPPGRGHYLRAGTPQVGGVRNAYLAYTYDTHSANGEIGTWHENDLLPVITHVDTSGRPTGRMFDTVLFMAGGSELDGYPTKASWDDLLSRLFVPNTDVAALDQAADTAQRALGRGTVRVILPIPNPVQTAAEPWGSLHGTTLDLNPTRVGEAQAQANRDAVVRWYIREALERYNATPHSHIQLVGFYWMREAVAPRSDDSQLVRWTSGLIHQDHLRFYWIPYYQAPGFQHWRDYGFDASMLQPNYFFDNALSAGDTARLRSTAMLARWSDQGVEIEGDQPMLTDPAARQKFLEYLSVFHQTGADKAIKGYYWGARNTLESIVTSTDPAVRSTYDDVYQFIRDAR